MRGCFKSLRRHGVSLIAVENREMIHRRLTRTRLTAWKSGATLCGRRRPTSLARATSVYENMRQVAPGDIVVSFCDTRIKAVGIVTDVAQTAPKPDFGNVGLNWSKEGWFVPIYYCRFESPLRPKDHMAILRHFLPASYSPLQATGDGLQSVYLAEPPGPMADALIGLIGRPTKKPSPS